MDIADITKSAKEFLLEDGTHAPTLFIQTDQQIIIAEVRDLPPTPDERLLAMRAMGRKIGQDRRGEVIKEVGFIVLVWASVRKKGDTAPRGRPSQDPNRKEMLMVSFLRLTDAGPVNEGEIIEILRDGQGKVRDLYHIPNDLKQQPTEDPLLLAFVKGYKSGNAPPAPPPQRADPDAGTGRHGKPPRRK